jgi:hypothetical protein
LTSFRVSDPRFSSLRREQVALGHKNRFCVRLIPVRDPRPNSPTGQRNTDSPRADIGTKCLARERFLYLTVTALLPTLKKDSQGEGFPPGEAVQPDSASAACFRDENRRSRGLESPSGSAARRPAPVFAACFSQVNAVPASASISCPSNLLPRLLRHPLSAERLAPLRAVDAAPSVWVVDVRRPGQGGSTFGPTDRSGPAPDGFRPTAGGRYSRPSVWASETAFRSASSADTPDPQTRAVFSVGRFSASCFTQR